MAELVGLKFPFQINSKGGVSLVKQEKNNSDLFDGKLEQLLGTNKGDRVMECDVFAELDTFLFESTDLTTKTLLEYQVKQCILQNMPEITVVSVDVYSVDNSLVANIIYQDKVYGTTKTSQVKVGDMG